MKKTLLTICILCAAVVTANAQFMKNDFLTGYTVGQDLEKGTYPSSTQGATNPIMLNQWNLSGKATDRGGLNPKLVAPLVYADYIDSNKDAAIDLLKLSSGEARVSIYSLSNNNSDFGAGSYYVTFLMNVSNASITSPGEFLSLDANYTGNTQRVRFTLKGIDATTFQVGLGDNAAATILAGSFEFGTTYLVVLKASIDGTGAGTGSVYINPNLTETEPTSPILSTPIVGTALTSIRGIVLRQRTVLAAQIGGIRFSDSWALALGQDLSSIENNNADKGNILSSKYYNLNGVEISEPQSAERGIIYLKKDLYENGTVETNKLIK